jgi:ABC-type branched-subunit amino acid transport system substrate-binding protein
MAGALTAAAIALTASACSSSGSTSSASAGGSSGPTASAQGPIKIMDISTLQSPTFGFPEALDGAKAAAMAINKAGGINGQQIQILSCNDQADPNVSAACAQQAVSEKVAAVVAGITVYGDHIVPILQAAGIPFIGATPDTDAELNSPIDFPADTGGLGTFAGVAHEMYQDGCRKLAILENSAAQAVTTANVAGAAFTLDGGKVVYTPTVAPTVPDMTPYVTGAINAGAGCVITLISLPNYIGFLTVARHSAKPNILIGDGALPPSVIAKLGPALTNGLIWASPTYPLPNAPQVQTFVAQMKAEGNAPADTFSHYAWAGVTIFAQAAKGLKDINNQTILAALGKLTATLSTYPTSINFSAPQPIKGASRIFDTTVLTEKIENGQLVAAGGQYNVLPALRQAFGGS